MCRAESVVQLAVWRQALPPQVLQANMEILTCFSLKNKVSQTMTKELERGMNKRIYFNFFGGGKRRCLLKGFSSLVLPALIPHLNFTFSMVLHPDVL